MRMPCEVVVWKILPAIKARLAKDLKAKGMSQKKIAQVLDLTEAAVSQYLSGKRAKGLEFDPVLNHDIDTVAEAISREKNKEVLTFGLCHLCKEAIQRGLPEEIKKEIPDGCVMCMQNSQIESSDEADESDDEETDNEEDSVEDDDEDPRNIQTNDLTQFTEFNEEGI